MAFTFVPTLALARSCYHLALSAPSIAYYTEDIMRSTVHCTLNSPTFC